MDDVNDLADLIAAGLSEDEARLIVEHRLTQVRAEPVALSGSEPDAPGGLAFYPEPVPFGRRSRWLGLAVALGLAIVSGLLVRSIIVKLTEGGPNLNEEAMLANFFLATMPFLAGYLAWLRRIPLRTALLLAGAGVVLALAVNLYPLLPGYFTGVDQMTYENTSQTGILTLFHLPIVLWLLTGFVFSTRLEFIRFTGEWGIFLILTWLAGGVIVGIIIASLNIAGVEIWRMGMGFSFLIAMLVPLWLFLSIWLAELTRNMVAKVLSVLTWVFTPIMLLALLIIFGVFLSSGTLFQVQRDLLILLDGVLILVLALVLYSVAARDPAESPKVFDWLQFTMIALAVVMNFIALIWMFVRLAEFGPTPNRIAALGLNLILMINLVWTAWLLFKFLKRNRAQALDAATYAQHDENAFSKVIEWQTNYLPAYLIWAAYVVLVFPLIFRGQPVT